MLKSEAEVETEVVVSDIPHHTIFLALALEHQTLSKPIYSPLSPPTSKNADFFVVTVRNRETKYYKLALLEKLLL